MEAYLVITIDTEIDKSLDWRNSPEETYFSVLKGIPDKLTPVFELFGAKPTYLLSGEVIENQDCVNTLKDTPDCELGTHLHGDVIEPDKRLKRLANEVISEMQCSYSNEIEYQKLKNLTDLFEEKFSYRPTSFRAGRFGAGNNTIKSLEKLNYLVDTSITPGVDWILPEGRANFKKAKQQPYFPDADDLLSEGNSRVLEVPVSILVPKIRDIFSSFRVLSRIKYFKRITNYLFPVSWLRPSAQSSRAMINVINGMKNKYYDNEILVFNMMFHSMEVIPGASPYVKTEKESKLFLKKIETVLHYCKTNNIHFVKLSELFPLFSRKGP